MAESCRHKWKRPRLIGRGRFVFSISISSVAKSMGQNGRFLQNVPVTVPNWKLRAVRAVSQFSDVLQIEINDENGVYRESTASQPTAGQSVLA
jgi:hypothetical protein